MSVEVIQEVFVIETGETIVEVMEVLDEAIEILEVALQGAPGRDGLDGGGTPFEETYLAVAGENIVLLTHIPAANSIELHINGLRQKKMGWTVVGQTVTIPATFLLEVNDEFTISYRY